MLLTSIIFISFLYQSVQSAVVKERYTRLPHNVEPIRYLVDIKPYFDEKHAENKNFTFDGYTTIEFKVLENTNSVTFHYCNLTINANSLYVNEISSKKNIKVINQIMNATTNFYTVVFDEPLLKDNNYTIWMEHSANLTDSLTGLYRSYYKDKNNKIQWMAVTYFEDIHAREAFPCFDEPQLKAIFDIRIRRLPSYKSISNMPIAKTIPDTTDSDERLIDIFETSKKMSTYLVAFIVTKYECVTNDFGNHSVCMMDRWTDSAKYNIELAESILTATAEYLQNDYLLPKLDHVVIPQFFPAGMENWGLITYDEDDFAFNPELNTTQEINKVALTMSHEIAHQWFGNLVTCEWWTLIWLNEGFATYMQYFGLHLAKPDWRTDEQFTIQTLLIALAIDDKNTAKLETDDPELQLEPQGLAITYAKAASIIRMMEHILTPPIFRIAVINYIKGKSSVNDEDLWRHFQEALDEYPGPKPNLGKLTVREIAKSWLKQSGYPLVIVERINSSTLKLSQVLYDDENINNENYTAEEVSDWWIPINYATGKNHDFSDTTAQHWLGKEPIFIQCDESDWIIINKRRTGYYRVFYDENSWINIQNALEKNNEIIPPVDRALLLGDSFNIYEDKDFSYFLNLSRFLESETDLIPWNVAYGLISFTFLNVQADKTLNQLFLEYAQRIMTNVYESVNGFNEVPSDDHVTKLKRILIVETTCKINYKKCWDDAYKKFNELRSGKIKTISPNLKHLVECAGIKMGTEEMWTSMLNKLNTTESNEKRQDILEYLACAENEDILNRYLFYLLDFEKNNIKPNEVKTILNNLLDKRYIRTNASKEFFLLNIEKIVKLSEDKQNKDIISLAIFNLVGSSGLVKEIKKVMTANLNSTIEELKEELVPLLQKSPMSFIDKKNREKFDNMQKWFEDEKLRHEKKVRNEKENEIDVDEYFNQKSKVLSSDSSFHLKYESTYKVI